MTEPKPTETARRTRTDVALGGWLWMMFGGAAQGAVTIGVVAVLARLLTPTDFGAVAAALLVINFAMILCQALVRPALVQHPSLRREHEETALVISITTGVALFGLLWVLAPFLSGVMDVPHLTPILRVLAVVLPIQALGAVAEGLLRREMRFRPVATVRAVSHTVGCKSPSIRAFSFCFAGTAGASDPIAKHSGSSCRSGAGSSSGVSVPTRP